MFFEGRDKEDHDSRKAQEEAACAKNEAMMRENRECERRLRLLNEGAITLDDVAVEQKRIQDAEDGKRSGTKRKARMQSDQLSDEIIVDEDEYERHFERLDSPILPLAPPICLDSD